MSYVMIGRRGYSHNRLVTNPVTNQRTYPSLKAAQTSQKNLIKHWPHGYSDKQIEIVTWAEYVARRPVTPKNPVPVAQPVPVDVLGRELKVGQKVMRIIVRPPQQNNSPIPAVQLVTRIDLSKGHVYTDNTSHPVKHPDRLGILTGA